MRIMQRCAEHSDDLLRKWKHFRSEQKHSIRVLLGQDMKFIVIKSVEHRELSWWRSGVAGRTLAPAGCCVGFGALCA